PDAGAPAEGSPGLGLPVAVAARIASAVAVGPWLAAAQDVGETAGCKGDRDVVVEVNPFTIGQAPDWLDRTHVVWQDPAGQDVDDDGEIQIYRSALDGTDRACLTCGLEGPNQVPVVQPHGQWILFHSWNGHDLKVGSPGLGGLRAGLWG